MGGGPGYPLFDSGKRLLVDATTISERTLGVSRCV